MKLLLRLLVLLAVQICLAATSYGIEHIFEGSSTSGAASVSLADQPAGLGWLPQRWSFSASGTSLNQTVYEFSGTDFQSSETPLTIRPLYVAAGEGTSWGGWSAQLTKNDADFRSLFVDETATSSMSVDMRSQVSHLRGSLAAGLRLSETWSIGWALHYLHLQYDLNILTQQVAAAQSEISLSEVNFQRQAARTSVATLFSTPDFRFGLVLISPDWQWKQQGQMRTRALDNQGGSLLDQVTDAQVDNTNNSWQANFGVRFGTKGNAFLFSHDYQTSGKSQITFGYQYRATWGLLTGSYVRANDTDSRRHHVVTGFVRHSETYDWGVGPAYTQTEGTVPGALRSKSYDILFASEIRY